MSATTAPTRQIPSIYRRMLRELPIRQPSYASQVSSYSPPSPSLSSARTSTTSTPHNRLTSPSFLQQRLRKQLSSREHTTPSQLQQAEQFIKYMQAQRQYVTLVERYNPGMGMTEEERVRLTARRVGMELPVEFGPGGSEGKKE